MAFFNENIVTGQRYRICTDKETNTWDRISFWTDANDVVMGNTNVKSALTANDENNTVFNFRYDPETDEFGYMRKVDGADTFCPFKNGIKAELLWEGDSSSTSVMKCDLSDNYENYDYICIYYMANYFPGYHIMDFKSKMTAITYAGNSSGGLDIYYRFLTLGDDGYSFTLQPTYCKMNATDTTNTSRVQAQSYRYCNVKAVYGIKGEII